MSMYVYIFSHTVDGCEILHQLIGGKQPIIHRVLTIQSGAGFLPSTVCPQVMEMDSSMIMMMNHHDADDDATSIIVITI